MKIKLVGNIILGIFLIILSLEFIVFSMVWNSVDPYTAITLRDDEDEEYFKDGEEDKNRVVINAVHPSFFLIPPAPFIAFLGFFLIYYNKKVILQKNFKHFTLVLLVLASICIYIGLFLTYFTFIPFSAPLGINVWTLIGATLIIFFGIQFIYCGYIIYFLYGIRKSKIILDMNKLYLKETL